MPSLWIWPFELQEKIGEGGMGIVYQARYVKDDRLFAVKLIPAEITNKTLIARFEREIEILKTLRHPNIVRAFGGVCEDKQRFYAMELVDGGTLWDKIQTHGFLPWEKVTDWGQQMCAALAYAHAKGIIHRDVKPNNFLVTKAGQLKLSDFGLVSVMSEAKLTADGRTLGTVQYMSPEQIRGKPPPHACHRYLFVGLCVLRDAHGTAPLCRRKSRADHACPSARYPPADQRGQQGLSGYAGAARAADGREGSGAAAGLG